MRRGHQSDGRSSVAGQLHAYGCELFCSIVKTDKNCEDASCLLFGGFRKLLLFFLISQISRVYFTLIKEMYRNNAFVTNQISNFQANCIAWYIMVTLVLNAEARFRFWTRENSFGHTCWALTLLIKLTFYISCTYWNQVFRYGILQWVFYNDNHLCSLYLNPVFSIIEFCP